MHKLLFIFVFALTITQTSLAKDYSVRIKNNSQKSNLVAGETFEIPGIVYEQYGKDLVLLSKDGHDSYISVFDLVSKENSPLIKVLDSPQKFKDTSHYFEQEVYLQPNGELMLLITSEKYYIYNYLNGQLVTTLKTKTSLEFSSYDNNPSWSPDGRYLAFQNGKKLLVWDSNTDTTQTIFNGFVSAPIFTHWRPDSKYISVIIHSMLANIKSVVYKVYNSNFSEVGEFKGSAYWDNDDRLVVSSNFEFFVYSQIANNFDKIGSFSVDKVPFRQLPESSFFILDKNNNQLNHLKDLGITHKPYGKISSPYALWGETTSHYSRLGDLRLIDANSEYYYITDDTGQVLLEIERNHKIGWDWMSTSFSFIKVEDTLYTISLSDKMVTPYKIQTNCEKAHQ